MNLSNLQPLDRVLVCRHALENPEWMINVDHRDAGDLDLMCNLDHSIDDMAPVHVAHLGVIFPQVRLLGDVPLGQTAIYSGGEWQLEDLPYDDGDDPGELPPPPDAAQRLDGWSFTCPCCSEAKTGLPELAFSGPVQVLDAEGDPNYEILQHTSDLCRIRIEGTEYFFIRGLLPIPIPEARDTYCFGAWSTISPQNFRRYESTFDEDQRDLGTMFGYLSNPVPGVPGTLGLQQMIVPGPPGKRPWLILHEPDEPHPLHEAQRKGVTIDQLLEWVGDHLQCDGPA